MRLLSSLPHYLATHDAKGIQIHQFASAEIGGELQSERFVKLNVVSEYPWSGEIEVHVEETAGNPWALSIRIPDWSQNPTVSINGKSVADLHIEKGYLVLDRVWKVDDVVNLDLSIEPMLVASNPRIDATRGCLAIQHGPIVYCLEDKDQEIQGRLLDVEIDPNQPLSSRWEDDLLGGVMVIEAQGQFADNATWQGRLYRPALESVPSFITSARLIAIPYYAWGNRKIDSMRVWIPEK
jgi:DUF1680 family protein